MLWWTVVGVLALTLALGNAGPARAINIVTNGGFETGDFTGWTLSGNTFLTLVDCGTIVVSPHTGECAAALGALGSDNALSQTILTVPGGTYLLSFWEASDGFTPNFFQANWDGSPVLGAVDDSAHGYINYTFPLVASTTSTTLEFLSQNDNGFLGLDDVSVAAVGGEAVPEPASLTLLGLGLVGLVGYQWRRQRTVTKELPLQQP
jgi:PEP-CTERM motif